MANEEDYDEPVDITTREIQDCPHCHCTWPTVNGRKWPQCRNCGKQIEGVIALCPVCEGPLKFDTSVKMDGDHWECDSCGYQNDDAVIEFAARAWKGND
jgi:hypothetical protein